MDLVASGLAYFRWHYSRALKDLIQIWRNCLWFIGHFFSLGILVRTLFAPWRRLDEGYKKGLEPGAWLETLIVNLLMRAVGFLIRAVFISVGSLLALIAALSLVPAILLWLAAPFLVLGLFLSGLILLI